MLPVAMGSRRAWVFRWRRLMSEGGKEAIRVAIAKSRRFPVKTVAATFASRPFQHYRTARRLSPAARSSEPSIWLPTSAASSTSGPPMAIADRRAPQARAAIRRTPARQRQAHLPPDEEARIAAAALYRPTPTRRARRQDHHDPLKHPLVCRCFGVHLLEWRDRAYRLRPRLPRPRGSSP